MLPNATSRRLVFLDPGAQIIHHGFNLIAPEDAMTIVPIEGLWETHLTVSKLDRSVAFYRDVVGLELAHTVPDRNVAFFWIGQPRQAMLGLWGTGNGPLGLRLHFAFQVTLAHVKESVAALRKAGLRPRSGDGDAIDEPEVIPWIPAASVYFDDPDGHSLEFIAMLPEAPRQGAPRVPLSKWKSEGA